MAPMRLRLRMSLLKRNTEKSVAGVPGVRPSSVRMWMAPSWNASAAAQHAGPARIGTTAPFCRPMRRLKNTTGVLLVGLLCVASGIWPAPWTDPAPAKLKTSCPSRKKSRFSGNSTLKRVRFTCASSSSTCAKSVL